jgi:hypothetical protein
MQTDGNSGRDEDSQQGDEEAVQRNRYRQNRGKSATNHPSASGA